MKTLEHRFNSATLTHSKFYSPAFNAAIFDGPMRIYFAQYQEGVALKIYFKIVDQLKETMKLARESMRQRGSSVFIMLYPNTELFEQSFTGAEKSTLAVESLGRDYVLGVRGPLSRDEEIEALFTSAKGMISEWLSAATYAEAALQDAPA